MTEPLIVSSPRGGLVLASGSSSRRAMLAAAGVPFAAISPKIDERGLEAEMAGEAPEAIARALAEAKALAVSRTMPERVVLGSDSLVAVEGRRFDKPRDRAEAAAHLAFFSGRVMELHSAAALTKGDTVLWRHAEAARLTVRTLTPEFIERYLGHEWPAVAACVGVFRIEGLGVHLFDAIEGSHFTVLGMPLLPVMGALRRLGEIPA